VKRPSLSGLRRFLRVSDWALYMAALVLLVALSLHLAENANAPRILSGSDPTGRALLGPLTPFDPAYVVDAPDRVVKVSAGTAFSIAGEGRWVTARHVVENCKRPALKVGEGQAVAAAKRLALHADIALLVTDQGPPALPVQLVNTLEVGQLAFHPGFPQGQVGEVSSRLLGYDRLRGRGRGVAPERVLAWAEVGRTEGLDGTLAGLSGAPALDQFGRVVGVTIAAAPRRGRIYTTAPRAFSLAIQGQAGLAGVQLPSSVTVENYGQVADELRRDLSVAQVVCLI